MVAAFAQRRKIAIKVNANVLYLPCLIPTKEGKEMATQEKPTAAFVLSLIGAIFILIGGLVVAAAGAIVAELGFAAGAVLAGLALICGIVVLISAIMLYVRPEQKVAWGVITIIFSIASLFFCLGGFIIGMILGIVGGALGIAWKPSPPAAPVPAEAPIKRICPKCGRVITEDVKFCPHCGQTLE